MGHEQAAPRHRGHGAGARRPCTGAHRWLSQAPIIARMDKDAVRNSRCFVSDEQTRGVLAILHVSVRTKLAQGPKPSRSAPGAVHRSYRGTRGYRGRRALQRPRWALPPRRPASGTRPRLARCWRAGSRTLARASRKMSKVRAAVVRVPYDTRASKSASAGLYNRHSSTSC